MQLSKNDVKSALVPIVVFAAALLCVLLRAVWGLVAFPNISNLLNVLVEALPIIACGAVAIFAKKGDRYNRLLLIPACNILLILVWMFFADIINLIRYFRYGASISILLSWIIPTLAEQLPALISVVVLTVLGILAAMQKKKNIFIPIAMGLIVLTTIISDIISLIVQCLRYFSVMSFVTNLIHGWPMLLMWIGLAILLLPKRATKQEDDLCGELGK